MKAKAFKVCKKCYEVFPASRREWVRGFIRKRLIHQVACPRCVSLDVAYLDVVLNEALRVGAFPSP